MRHGGRRRLAPIESGILLASITAMLLDLLLNGARHADAAIIAAARQAEAH